MVGLSTRRTTMPFHGLAGRNQKAVLWVRVGTDLNSQPVVSTTPEELDVRWDAARRTVPGTDGTPVTIDGTVISDRDIPIGSAVWEGSIDDLPGTGLTPTSDVYSVVSSERVPDWRGREYFYEVGIQKAGSTLPTQQPEP